MSKVIEVYRILKDKLGEEEARVVAEAFEELGGVRKDIATKQDINNLKLEIKQLEKEIKGEIRRLDNRIWWIVGIILVQWLSLMIAIVFR